LGCEGSNNLLRGGCAGKNKSGLIHENNVQVHGVVTATKIKIHAHAKPHLVEYIELQMEAMDDERFAE
jgi:hypothetical protein